MKISKRGLDFIKQWEGVRSQAYQDVSGNLTIGIGHLLTKDELSSGKILIDGQLVSYRDNISHDQAIQLLRQDLVIAEAKINRTLSEIPADAPKISQWQYDALCSLVFNIGVGAFAESTLRKKLIAGLFWAVPEQLERWVYSGGRVIKGLENRREAESLMWQKGLQENAVVADSEVRQNIDDLKREVAKRISCEPSWIEDDDVAILRCLQEANWGPHLMRIRDDVMERTRLVMLQEKAEANDQLIRSFAESFAEFQAEIHDLAIEKGWYDGQSSRSPLELLALIVEEFGEAVHAIRDGNPESKKIVGYSCLEEELADIVIRIMDAAEYHKVRLAQAIVAKHEFNKTRPERHGGKLY